MDELVNDGLVIVQLQHFHFSLQLLLAANHDRVLRGLFIMNNQIHMSKPQSYPINIKGTMLMKIFYTFFLSNYSLHHYNGVQPTSQNKLKTHTNSLKNESKSHSPTFPLPLPQIPADNEIYITSYSLYNNFLYGLIPLINVTQVDVCTQSARSWERKQRRPITRHVLWK